jgi:hypothetical protein
MAIILNADDYAIADGVSRGIEELAAVRRLSATSALVTTAAWARHAASIAGLAEHIAVGLHLNLTLGDPLGPMPTLAPGGRLPTIGALAARALSGRIPVEEVAAETERQIERFMADAGRPPDHVDGHQHAHALPGVRDGVLAALRRRLTGRDVLVRDPADRAVRVQARGAAVAKSLSIGLLAAGFGRAVCAAGFRLNDGFAGASSFDRRSDFAGEMERFLSHPGRCHLVMCHPGHADAELAWLDPVTGRREDELAALKALPALEERIWHPRRGRDGLIRNWPGEEAVA